MSNGMPCFEKRNKNSFDCCICSRLPDDTYERCKMKTQLKRDKENEYLQLKEKCHKKCKYHNTAFDDGYYEFDTCNIRGCGYGRSADDCKPTLECLQYCE